MDGDEQVGFRGCDGERRIDDDHLGAMLDLCAQEVMKRLAIAFGRVESPDEYMLGVLEVVATASAGPLERAYDRGKRCVEDAVLGGIEQRCAHGGAQAFSMLGVGGDVSGAAQEAVGPRTVLLGDLFPFVGNGGDSLVPADLLPFALAALAYALHGIFQAVFSIDAQRMGQPLVANAGYVGVALLSPGRLDDFPVSDVHVHLAAGAAAPSAGAGLDDVLARTGLLLVGNGGLAFAQARSQAGRDDCRGRALQKAPSPNGSAQDGSFGMLHAYASPSFLKSRFFAARTCWRLQRCAKLRA